MSWSGTCSIPKATSREDARNAISEIAVAGNEDAREEREAAAAEAKKAAISLLESGCIGDPATANVYVNISGHACPGHTGGSPVVQVNVTRSMA